VSCLEEYGLLYGFLPKRYFLIYEYNCDVEFCLWPHSFHNSPASSSKLSNSDAVTRVPITIKELLIIIKQSKF
jgi:hypothetical protein